MIKLDETRRDPPNPHYEGRSVGAAPCDDDAMDGWIALHRRLLDSPTWQRLNAEHRLVMITILLLANWKRSAFGCRRCGKEIPVEPGELVYSAKSIAERASVSESCARRAIRKLIKFGFMRSQSATRCHTHYVIENWDKYQVLNQEATQERQQERRNTDARATQERRKSDSVPNKGTREQENKRTTPGARVVQTALDIPAAKPRPDLWAVAEALRRTIEPPISDKLWRSTGRRWVAQLSRAVDHDGHDLAQVLDGARRWTSDPWLSGGKDGQAKIADMAGLLRHYRRLVARPAASAAGGYCREDIPES